ncbi:uncharacterized protein LACBIDRAFT_310068 [Laccaria bicolor S238N-H82]|uniref:Predicted protein n=1 Tax=Laccaria bicolor (strain S238N-H82 / ATCC MYA-4686) TaxID=486041 RepID=B0DTK9_LACBS|nr:uncharacterized protein LACBIDRAFT_310068 [Laccaria bicolor S238N-H82]EDR02134.1 predicted protein [Laccaria bicolor S238N-H82]|eukprot:XP_001887291.1 predicted protein [Laccaria bicolor S238N-H82]
MPLDEDLATALQLPVGSDDEAASTAIIALLTSAAHDAGPKYSLSEIHHLISKSGCSDLLDPLNSIPLLLSCDDPAAGDLLSLIGECCSAKEVVISVQEAVERLEVSLNVDDDGFEEVEQKVPQQAASSPVIRLSILTGLYAASIPRLKLRKKTAPDTLRPLLTDLENVNVMAGSTASTEEGRALISATASLVKRAAQWVKDTPDAKEEDVLECTKLMKNLLDQNLTAYAHCIRSSVAQRIFEQCFPRLTIKTCVSAGWEEGEKAVLEALDAYTFLGCTYKELTLSLTTATLVVLAYHQTGLPDSNNDLAGILPILISSLQTNSALDECLSILLKFLHRIRASSVSPPPTLSPEVVTPLCTILPTIASAHPDPVVRHQAFRIISSLLTLTQPDLRIQLLADLTGDSQLPQMRVAAVGLVKEAIIESISSTKPNLFASPLFLRVFRPILFRPDPPDLFSGSKELSLGGFQESSEPQRLVECLALYYVLLQRDHQNLTGIRDADVLSSVESSLLEPLRSILAQWMSHPSISGSHMHAIMSLVSLQMGLERVDAAIAQLRSPRT